MPRAVPPTRPVTAKATATTGRRWARRIGLCALLATLVGSAALAGAVAWALPQLPPLDRVLRYQPRQPLQVFTIDGVEIAQFGPERRQFVPISQIPPLLQQAVLAVEDSRFRSHAGIDPIGVARALWAAATGGLRQGASTITQQVARTFFLSSRFTAERKLKEAMLALKIEQQLSKDQILELYMNQIYLGQRAYGFAAAADTYFGKPLAALTLAECALLAGLPQNPAYANPVTNLARAIQRQRAVLQRMLATGAISPAQQQQARAQPLQVRSTLQVPLHAEHVAEMARLLVVARFGEQAYSNGIRVTTALRAADQHAAWAAVRRQVLAFDARQPWRGPEDHEDLPAESSPDIERSAALALRDHADDEQLRVAIVRAVSPRVLHLQLATGEQLRISGDGLRAAQAGLGNKASADLVIERGDILRVMALPTVATTTTATTGSAAPSPTRWAVVQWPEVQAAFVALDAASGRVRALVGGFDFSRQPFDHVTQAWRQPGSALKPFVYSAALEHGVMPATLVNDGALDNADGWDPQNADGRFDGPLTVREALVRSKNLVSVRLLRHIGLGPALDWLAQFGFETSRQPQNLTLALGAGSTTPLRLAQAYAVLANGGWPVAPVVIERITDAQGTLLFEAPQPLPLAGVQRVVPARNVFITNSLLNDVAQLGTAAKAQAQLQRPDLYGKTGTTNDAVDAWFAGFQTGPRSAAQAGAAAAAGTSPANTGLVAVAWMGHDQPRSLGVRESGGGLALPIWIDYMAVALKGLPAAAAPQPPDGVVRRSGDWVYSEWAEGGDVARIGLDAPAPMPPPAALPASLLLPSQPASAASAIPANQPASGTRTH